MISDVFFGPAERIMYTLENNDSHVLVHNYVPVYCGELKHLHTYCTYYTESAQCRYLVTLPAAGDN